MSDRLCILLGFNLPWEKLSRLQNTIARKTSRSSRVGNKIRIQSNTFEFVWRTGNLLYETEIDIQKPVCSCNSDWLLGIGKHSLNGLYDACSEVLTFREETGTINETVLGKYQELYQKTVQRLGMEQLYLKGN